MELFKANQQWSTRPADERFESLEALYAATKAYADTAIERSARVADLRTEADRGDVLLVGKQNVPARLTHWAFGQMSARVGAPAGYLRELPATLACQNLNHGLKERAEQSGVSETAQLMFHANGSLLLRAFTSEQYARIWNHEVAARLLDMQSYGWTPARPDMHWGAGTVGTCIACGGKGSSDAPLSEHYDQCTKCKGTGREMPALYASDHDMFAFVRNNTAIVKEPGNADGLQRGVIVENSEVGASALKLTRFLYREMCGNHIIWGASKVMEISVRHVGDARRRWGLYQYELKRYAESSASLEEGVIASAKTKVIAQTKEQVLDKLFGIRSLQLSRKAIESGYEAVNESQDGAPNTVWGMVQGLTRYSQTLGYADARTGIDRAAGRILEVGQTF